VLLWNCSQEDQGVKQFCEEQEIRLIAYGVLCGGLLNERWVGVAKPCEDDIAPSQRKYLARIRYHMTRLLSPVQWYLGLHLPQHNNVRSQMLLWLPAHKVDGLSSKVFYAMLQQLHSAMAVHRQLNFSFPSKVSIHLDTYWSKMQYDLMDERWLQECRFRPLQLLGRCITHLR
jgi:hypothetical protein